MIDFSLKGKVALITGASRGIGEALAYALAQNGAHCILVSRKQEALEVVAAKIKEDGGQADAIACNMGYIEQIDKLFQEVEKRFGKLDILINNAATNPYFGEMINMDEGAWNKTLEVNLKGPFFMTQFAAKLMEKGGGGSIVNVSSVNGIRPAPMQGVYSVTKAGLINMTKGYASELADKNIRVNALLPGLTKTKFAGALFENKDIYDLFMDRIPMKRHAEPDEMAGAVLYLGSDAASYTTDICITCDGGSLI